jgi:hypothetical protein
MTQYHHSARTWFTVTYRKLNGFTDLVVTNVVDDRRVAMRKADFLARASRIANNKARELGWIVEGKATPSIFLR